MEEITVKNKIYFLILILVLICNLISCDPPTYAYRGDNISLYTAANNSILGMRSGEMDQIYVLETDEYGRNLYFIRTRAWVPYAGNEYIAALLVSQSSSDTDVSYYEYDNVICCYTKYFDVIDTAAYAFFSDEQKSELKRANDWGEKIKVNKLTTKGACSCDVDSHFIDETARKSIAFELFGDDNGVFSDPLTQFLNGKRVYLFCHSNYGDIHDSAPECYLVVFCSEAEQTGKGYSCVKIEDISQCQEQLKNLLNDN